MLNGTKITINDSTLGITFNGAGQFYNRDYIWHSADGEISMVDNSLTILDGLSNDLFQQN